MGTKIGIDLLNADHKDILAISKLLALFSDAHITAFVPIKDYTDEGKKDITKGVTEPGIIFNKVIPVFLGTDFSQDPYEMSSKIGQETLDILISSNQEVLSTSRQVELRIRIF